MFITVFARPLLPAYNPIYYCPSVLRLAFQWSLPLVFRSELCIHLSFPRRMQGFASLITKFIVIFGKKNKLWRSLPLLSSSGDPCSQKSSVCLRLLMREATFCTIWKDTKIMVFNQHFNYQPTRTTLKNVELLKHSKISKTAPTCFGLQGNHLQGVTVST